MAGNLERLYRSLGSPKRVKADAYGFVSEGLYSKEMEKLYRIERFGLKAITGRDVFYHGEFLNLVAAKNIVFAYQSSQRAANWAEWSESNPDLAEILVEATRLHAERTGK